jgi:hypothetical protein
MYNTGKEMTREITIKTSESSGILVVKMAESNRTQSRNIRARLQCGQSEADNVQRGAHEQRGRTQIIIRVGEGSNKAPKLLVSTNPKKTHVSEVARE